VVTEIADVLIMSSQLAHHFGRTSEEAASEVERKIDKVRKVLVEAQ